MTETTKKPAAKKPRQKKSAKALQITLVHSPIGTSYRHKATVKALGLRRILQTVEQADTPQVRGMLAKVGHLVHVKETVVAAGKEKQS